MVSSISSTPSRNRFAKTGGTTRTIDALTEQNSSSAFSLRTLLGEMTTSMDTGELFRFISLGGRGEELEPDQITQRGHVLAFPAHVPSQRWILAPEPPRLLPAIRRHQLYFSCPCPRVRHSMVCVIYSYLWRKMQYFLFLVGSKNYHPDPHHGDANIWKGTAGGRPTGREKCV